MGRPVAARDALIDADRLLQRAAARGVRPPVWTAETTSTQDAVRTWAMAQRPEGSALWAEVQTEGRGRLGRPWVASFGQAVQMSVLLRPRVPASRLPLVALAAGVAVRQAVHGRVGLKWPNDLLAPDGRKVAGVLAEAEVVGAEVRWVVVGVGVNVHGVPPDVPDAACLDELGPPLAREDVAVDLVLSITGWTRRVADDPAGVLHAWRRGCAMLGRFVRVGDRLGTAEDVAEDGALLLRTPEGRLERVVAGDVQMVDVRGAGG